MSRGRLVLLLVLVALAVPGTAAADDDDGNDDVRVDATCSPPVRAELRLRERDDDRLRLDFELRDRRAGRWLVVVVHERRLVFRNRLRTDPTSGRIRLRRTLPDLFGEDTVRVRASGPRRASCRASASLADD